MSGSDLIKRVSTLEYFMKELAYQSFKNQVTISELGREMKEFKDEMKEFKNEMREFKDDIQKDMKEFKDEMKDFKDEMKDFKDEMKDFKDEMKDFKDEMCTFKRDSNKQWGDLANKLGSIVEDIVAPNIPRIAQEYFGCAEIEYLMVRSERRNPSDRSRRREFDVIALWDDSILLNETKATVRDEYLANFVEFVKTREFFDYFPEYAGKTLIPIFSSLYISSDKVQYLSRAGIYAMAMTDATMDLVNFEACEDARVKRLPTRQPG